MDVRTKAEELVQRIQEAEEGFQSTVCKGKVYSNEEMRVKNEWLEKEESATKEWFKSLDLYRSYSPSF